MSLAMRWLIASARKRSGKSMAEKLAAELLDAVERPGRDDQAARRHPPMAEANKAFAHYRW